MRRFMRSLLIGCLCSAFLMLAGGSTYIDEPAQAQVEVEEGRNAEENKPPVSGEASPEAVGETPPPDVLSVPEPLPPLREMLTVAVTGPSDGMRGDKAYFRAIITGQPQFVSWEITPKVQGLDVLADHLSSSFANREPGLYTIRCVISGPTGHATGEAVYEILQDAVATPPPATPAVAHPAGVDPTQPQGFPQMQMAPQGPKWPEGIGFLASRVNSNTRQAEGKMISGSIRSVINRARTGTLANEDPWVASYVGARQALGDAFPAWEGFFKDLFALVSAVRRPGMDIAKQNLILLESTADVLGAL